MGAKRPWTLAEVRYVEQHYRVASNLDIAQALGRSPQAVASLCSRRGWLRLRRQDRTRRVWTAEELAILARDYGRVPLRDLAARLGRTTAAVRTRAGMLRAKRPVPR